MWERVKNILKNNFYYYIIQKVYGNLIIESLL